MKFRLVVSFGLLLASATVFAKDSNVMRGGLGFIFQDHNSGANPGQYAISHGMGVQAMYQRPSKETDPVTGLNNPQVGGVNAVFGNGRFGLGAGVTRVAGDVLKNTNSFGDMVTAGAGFALAKERITLGASYSRAIGAGATNAANLLATATLQAPNRQGPAIAFGYMTTLDAPVKMQGLRGGIGYAFKNKASLEANVSFFDTNDFNNYELSAWVTGMHKMEYFGGGWMYNAVLKQHAAAARLGLVIGKHFDFSVLASAAFVSDMAFNYGGTLRVTF